MRHNIALCGMKMSHRSKMEPFLASIRWILTVPLLRIEHKKYS